MGIFGANNSKNQGVDREDSPAMKFVKEVMGKCIKNGIETIVISENNGIACCALSTIAANYINVRNRIAVMTDVIMPQNNAVEQNGLIVVSMEGKEMTVTVRVDDKTRLISLKFLIDANQSVKWT